MSLKENIEKDIDQALRDHDEIKSSTLRLLKASLKNQEIANKKELKEDEVQQLVASQIKKHKESIEEYKKAGRDELTAREEKQLEILIAYLPPQLSEAELVAIVDKVIKEKQATSPKQFGMVMSGVMKEARGLAEGNKVKELVQKALGSAEE